MQNSPVFVCGALRSGSTMLHLMLDGHPNIDNAGEFDFLFDLLGDKGEPPIKEEFIEWLRSNRIFQSQNLIVDNSLSVYELINSFVQQIKHKDNILALNVHRNFHRIPFVFPDAKYIHLIRDPRDVAKSCVAMGWAGNVYYGVDHWVNTEDSWQALSIGLDRQKYFTVRYEDLVVNAEEELTRICQFFHLPYSPAMLSYNEDSTYSKPDATLIEQWRDKLTLNEIKQVESKAKGLMGISSYNLSGGEAKLPSMPERLKLKVYNIIYKNIFSIKRYGVYLYLNEKAARKLGFKKKHTNALLQCNEIDKRYLK